MSVSGKGRFLIISSDSAKLADFCQAANQSGILWQEYQGGCQCLGMGTAREQAAAILAGLICGPWERRWLSELAARRYESFNNRELCLLLDKAIRLTEEDDFCWGLFAGDNRRARLEQALAQHLRYCSFLNLEGFWRFRLEGYREYLQTLLSIAADEVLSEQEDLEYVLLLRKFMAGRPIGGEIHVFLLRQGMYDICVAAGDGLRFIEGGRLHDCEDMLIYSLVALAPARLTIHIEQPLPPSLTRLLQELFGPALRLEPLCELSRHY